MDKFKEKHEQLKSLNIDLVNQIKSAWANLKGLKGNAYKKARL